MSYTALYRKFRPQEFEDVKGQDHIVTTLKTIEPHVLKALIKEDIRMHPMSKISDIANRIPDVDIKEIRKQLYNMIGTDIEKEGTRFDSKYYIK